MKPTHFVLFALLLFQNNALAENDEIVSIEVKDNSKTEDDTVLLIANVETGDRATQENLERMRIDLVSSGLFKDVSLTTSPQNEGVKLTISAVDKHSWIIAPTAYFQPGNIGGGIGYGENNLYGQNKKLLLYAQIATQDSLFLLGYINPSIRGTPFYWQFDVLARHEAVTEFDSPDAYLGEPEPERLSLLNYYNSGIRLGLNLWRGFSFDARLRGAYVSMDPDSVEWAEGVDPETHLGAPKPPLAENGWDISTEFRIKRSPMANWYGVRTGSVVQLSYETARPSLGSDFDYWVGGATFQKGWQFLPSWNVFGKHNPMVKFFAGIGHNLPFQQEFVSGGTSLRGYQGRQFRGDTKVGWTSEYSLQMFSVGPFALRGQAFWDSAYTSFTQTDGNDLRNYLPGQTDDQISKWRNGVGGGFRIYLRNIVLPLLGVDIAYGIEAEAKHVYFALGLTDL